MQLSIRRKIEEEQEAARKRTAARIAKEQEEIEAARKRTAARIAKEQEEIETARKRTAARIAKEQEEIDTARRRIAARIEKERKRDEVLRKRIEATKRQRAANLIKRTIRNVGLKKRETKRSLAANLIKRTIRKVGLKKRQMKRDLATRDAASSDQFIFWSNSVDLKPGEGKFTGNRERAEDPSRYAELATIQHWRKMLSNFDVAEFAWDGADVLPVPYPKGTRWRSIEHAFQSAKFWVNSPFVEGVLRDPPKGKKQRTYTPQEFREAALRFSLNSGDKIGKGDGAVAQQNRKLLKLTAGELSRWAGMSDQVMASAARAKYSQNPDRMRMLRLTAPAKLLHLMKIRGKDSKFPRFQHLEDIRDA